MIINIRGTSGSGKSTVMRRVMEYLTPWISEHKDGRKQPLYYYSGDNPDLIVLGHYETPCGGCDTIGSARAVYELIQTLPGKTILCEGLLLSEDTKWCSQLKDLRVVYLNTPLERCLKQIEGRRRAAGNVKPLNTANTANRVDVICRSEVKLKAAGVTCVRASDVEAPVIIAQWIGEGLCTAKPTTLKR